MRKTWILLASLTVLLGLVDRALPVTWTGGGADDSWCTPENWDANFVPGLWDTPVISMPERGPVIDCDVTVAAIQGPMWNSPNDQIMDVESGTVVVNYGWDWSSGTGTATINISGTPDITINSGWQAPDNGTGVLNITGDPNIIVYGVLGGASADGSSFDVNMSSGYVYADFVKFGNDGGGELSISGGTIDVGGDLEFTGGAGNPVTLNMSGGSIIVGGEFAAPAQFSGVDAITINLERGTIECGSFTHAGVAYVLDINYGILIIDGDVRDEIIADVNAGYITAHNSTGKVVVSYDAVTTKTTVSATPVVAFETATSSGFESESPAVLTVILYNPPEVNIVEVNYAPTGGTAAGGNEDYNLPTGTLTFLPGGPTSKTIEITIVDDGLDEEDETIEVTLFNPVNAILQETEQHTYTIIDPRPFVEFEVDASSGRENISSANIPVILSWPSTETVTVDYNVTGGTATGGGEDYSLLAGTLVLDPCEVTKHISITIVDDDLDEFPDETIEITLSNPSNARLGVNAQHTFTLLPSPVWLCPEGDLDGDCDVDFNDLRIFSGQWLDPPGGCSDFNCADQDGINGVDMFDFAMFAGGWGQKVWPVVINELMASNTCTIEDPNEPPDGDLFPDWFELYNASPIPVDLGGMYLTDKLDNPTKWQIPGGVTIDAWGFLIFWADENPGQGPTHADFKLSADNGEDIGLFDTDGITLLDCISFGPQTKDISYGLYPDASNFRRFLGIPTPGWENNGAYLGEVADTKFSHNRGFYDSPFTLSITCNTKDAEIHYTTDGSRPDEWAVGATCSYTGPFDINQTTVVRAAAFRPGYLATNVDTHTYIFGANSFRKALPTISLVSGELVDRTGPVSMELINGDPNIGEGFQADCESEPHSSNSYRIKFKAGYGDAELNYAFFEAAPLYADSAVDRFDRLVLRAGRHAPVTYVGEPWTRITQIAMGGPGHGGHSMVMHFYLNGSYEGVINPVERPDAWFASSYFGGNFEDYFATNHHELSGRGEHYLSGDPNRYETLLAMAGAKNLEDPCNYEVFKGLCDVRQFADYVILYFYTDFSDGPDNNYYAFMRNIPLEGSVPPEGLMYFMWDAEFVFAYDNWPYIQPRFSHLDVPISIIWQALLENADFRILFADRVYKHCFNDGALTEDSAQERWDIIYDHIASGGVTPYVMDGWSGCWPGIQLYPDIDPPIMTPHGGYDPTGFAVTMCGSGPIYYTLDGSDPRQAVTGNPVGTLYTGSVALNKSKHVKARVFDEPNWSALNEAVFAVGPVADDLRITEIMYHPQDTNDPNDPNTEFIELKNVGSGTLNLNLVRFTNGVDFTFPADIDIPAGGYVVVVKDQNAFNARYPGFSGVVAGEYTGSLNNAGERVELEDALGQTILNFRYEDTWRPITDGEGFSLTIINANNSDVNSWGEKQSWRSSAYMGGSPCWDDADIVPNPGAVVINEVMAHSHLSPDWIELYNTTGSSIDLGGWFLSDSDTNVMKYEIASGTSISAGGYLLFYEDVNFADMNDPGCLIPFAFSENGEQVCLSSGVDGDGNLTGYREVEDFGASASNVSFGRYFKASTGNYNFVAMDHNTPKATNAYPKVGPIVINEIMYHPNWPNGSPYDNEKFEYVELYNITGSDVNLYDEQGNPWKFTDAIEFTFPADANIPAYGYSVVVKDITAFSWRYGSMPAGVQVFGSYDGQLNNGGEKLELSMAGDVDEFGTRHYIRVDRVNYSDGSHPEDCPGGVDLWPVEADGGGKSLGRFDVNLYGNDPNNWDAANPSPGSVNP